MTIDNTFEIEGQTWEGAPVTTAARAVLADGTAVVAGDLVADTGSFGTGWDLRVYKEDSDTASTAVYSLDGQDPTGIVVALVNPSDYVNGGHNFLHQIVTSAYYFAQGRYRLEYILNVDSVGPLLIVNRLKVKRRVTSSTGA